MVVDTTNAATTNRAKATAFFTEVAGQLQAVGATQGVAVSSRLSIVGLERVPGFGYYEAKLAHEAALLCRATAGQHRPRHPVPRISRAGPFSCRPRAPWPSCRS